MFSASFEDEEFFHPQNNSNLATLFGTNSASENNDLIYVAPKQPKPINTSKQKPEQTKQQNTVLFAKLVQVYKVVNKVHKAVGKYGLALIGDSTQVQELLLYKDKQNILARATFTQGYQIYFENDHVSFQDNNKERWHIKFEEKNFLIEFMDELKKSNIEVVEENVDDSFSTSITSTDSSTKSDDYMSEESSVSQTRADILSRMAKMGQPILPNIIRKNSQDDSEDNSNSSSANSKSNKDLKTFENSKKINSSSSSNSTRNSDIPQNVSQPYVINPNNSTQLAQYVPIINPNMVNTVITPSEFTLFASENRIQNSEIRMNLTALSSKLDTVLQEVCRIKDPTNTDRLENEFLKSKIIDLEKNLNDSNKKLMEYNNSTNKYLELEKLIQKKNEEINEGKVEISQLQKSLDDDIQYAQNEIKDLKLIKNKLEDNVKNLQSQVEDAGKKLDENDSNYMKLQEVHENVLRENAELIRKINILKLSNKTDSPSNNIEQKGKKFSSIIKQLMNSMFQNIISEIQEDNESSLNNELKTILSSNIKQTTFNVIQQFEKVLQPPENSDTLINTKETI